MFSAPRVWAWAHDTIHVPHALHLAPSFPPKAFGVVKRLVGAILLTAALIVVPTLSIAAVALLALTLAMEVVKLL